MVASSIILVLGLAASVISSPVGPADPGSRLSPGSGPGKPSHPGKSCKPSPNTGKFDYDALSLREVGARNTLVDILVGSVSEAGKLTRYPGLANLARAQLPTYFVLARRTTLSGSVQALNHQCCRRDPSLDGRQDRDPSA